MRVNNSQTGILLVNLGTPDNPTLPAVKRYLKQFLQDKRVVDKPSWYWKPILHTIILPKHLPKAVIRYQAIWQNDGSPLMVYSRQILLQLQQAFPNFLLGLAMTYGKPSIESTLYEFRNIDRLIILPLFPQYSSATTGAVWDAVQNYFKYQKRIPEIHFVRDYASHPDYIFAVAKAISDACKINGVPDILLFSYHGVPLRHIKQGDDYHNRCELTTKLVAQELDDIPYRLTYQSQFGKEPWLSPNTSDVIASLPKQGIRRLMVVCPGFSCDCLETLEEVNLVYREQFMMAGGNEFYYVPALNNDKMQMQLLINLIKYYSK